MCRWSSSQAIAPTSSKRAIKFPYPDLSTVEQRCAACEAELSLNPKWRLNFISRSERERLPRTLGSALGLRACGKSFALQPFRRKDLQACTNLIDRSLRLQC